MRKTTLATAASLCLGLAACGERGETVTDNLSETVGVEAGGAAEVGRPSEMNVTNTSPPAEGRANAAADTAAE